MEFCEYCKVGAYSSYCTCKITGEICPFVRKFPCIQQWKPLDAMNNCKIRKDENMIPTGENKVRFVKNGKLFVEIEEFVVEILNPFDYDPQTVAVVNVDGEYYVKGYEPKKKATKKYTKEKIETSTEE